MKTYDIIVIGSGAGNILVDEALRHGFKTALVDRGPVGGTCLNLGCIPSKMLIYPANQIMAIKASAKLGIAAEIRHIDFPAIMDRMRKAVSRDRRAMQDSFRNARGLDFYETDARFSGSHILNVGTEQIRADRIVIAAGAAPLLPDIAGLKHMDYLTNESVLQLTRKPDTLIIIGGGYIAVEYAHFFSAMGTRVTLIQRGKRLLKEEEPEISRKLEKILDQRLRIHTRTEATRVRHEKDRCIVTAVAKDNDAAMELEAEVVMIAAGRQSNAAGLKVENTGVDMDDSGYIHTNEYLETSQENIWAIGDINGKGMFRHAANYEAFLVAEAIFHDQKLKMDYWRVPHAVFSYPEIASVGLTQKQALEIFEKDDLLTGYVNYGDTARGEAMMDTDGFAKVIVDKNEGLILGFHIIGAHASILIQEAVNAMASEDGLDYLVGSMHIHPALSEVVQDVFQDLSPIE